MNDNPKEQGAWNVPILLETIERNRRERDEARRWARRMYAKWKKSDKYHEMWSGVAATQAVKCFHLESENSALRRELETAAADALDARKAWGVAEAECMRLRRELDTLRSRQ